MKITLYGIALMATLGVGIPTLPKSGRSRVHASSVREGVGSGLASFSKKESITAF